MSVKISSHSGIYCLKSSQQLNTNIDAAWHFFSSPNNLEAITPKDLKFTITSKDYDEMYSGQIITYKIQLFPGIKTNWVTEITNVVDKVRFVDEQRFGPYAMWHHIHSFETNELGVLMHDTIYFKLPFGFLGRMFYPILIKPKLTKIFSFRFSELNTRFKS